CEPLAHVLQSLGAHRGMVVTGKVPGADGAIHHLDELSTLGENTIAEFYQERGFTASALDPHHFPLQPATLADLAGGDRDVNAEIIRRILHGEERGPKRDAVLLNAAAGLFVANRAKSFAEGWTLAGGIIDGGQAAKKLRELAT
ncbi:MAG TPA: anthranilate phosphoribosyltransferase, partial [Verrucomicrobiae bacterium]|nr:anthranilate phosphoribosyltransferase [Verrucomicrobiae bacterium]